MKLKILIAILLAPFYAMAVQTNVSDNVLIRNNFQFTGGVIGLGKVLTSDAAGYYTPQSLAALGAFAVTNGNNTFTIASTNTFLAPTFTSNMFIRGYLGINTNGPLSGSNTVVIRPAPGQTANHMMLISDGVGNDAGYTFGDPAGIPLGALETDGAGGLRLDMTPSLADFYLRMSGEVQMRITSSLLTFGNNSSDAYVFNGGTITYAHTPQINTNVLKIPSAGGTLTNGTSFVSLNIVQGSNVVATSTDLWARWISGSSTNAIFDGGGSTPLQTTFVMQTRTNTLTAALPVVNAIYTNNAQRMNLNVTADLATTASFVIWTVSGANTNFIGQTTDGTIGGARYSINGWIQPLALYSVSNTTGAVTLTPGRWNETRF